MDIEQAATELAFLDGSGETGALIAAHDWSTTPLGPIGSWPQSLKTMLGFLLRSPVPMVMLWGEDGVMLYNDGYSIFAGGRHPEQLGMPVRTGWPEVADFNDNVMKVGLAGGTLAYKDQEFTLYRHGRPEQVFMNLDYSPVLDDAGCPAGVMAVVIETTERVAAERALRQERDRGRDVLDNMGDAFALLDKDFRIIDMNAEAWRMESRPREEVIGKTHWEAHPNASPELNDLYRKAMADRVPALLEHRYVWPDGRETWIDMRTYPVEGGLAILYRDISERKLAEAALQASSARAEALAAEQAAILGQLAEGVIVTDPAGRITFVNDAATRIHGVARLDVEPDAYSETYQLLTLDGAPYPSHELPLARAVLNGETVTDAAWRICRPDRTEVLAVGSARPLLDSAGQTIGAVLTMRDDTARAEAETLLVEMNDELERRVLERTRELEDAQEALRQSQKMEAVGQLTGGIAHDFNNLLTGVIGSLDMMQRRMAKGEMDRIERYATTAMTAANRAAALTHRLLAFSRRQPLDPKPVNANRLVTGMEDLLRRTIGESVQLEIVTAGGLWQTLCDPHQLESAVLNLALNARDAMPDGGTLTIETCNAHLDSAYAASQRDVKPGQYICICVTDTGTGMNKDTIKKAFEPFFTTKPIGQGTGLGLSMIYGFTRQSEGYARIYSEVDEGTTIKLYLPRYYGEAEEIEETSSELTDAHRAGAGEVVLVVEDETAVRDLVVDVLQELGYRAIEAVDGPSGLKLLQSKMQLDLLVTDIGLPGLNGRHLADAARQHRPDLKILFMTGYAENATIANGFLEPGMEMITKPFAIEALVTRIRDMIERD